MDITPYVESLRRDLLAAATGAGDEVQQVAERLGLAIDAATRLALMEAVSQAAAEITAEMSGGAVDVRLEGRDLGFTVHEVSHSPGVPAPSRPPTASATVALTGPEALDEGGLARITLRLPESVKNRADEAAGQAGQSLNTWLAALVRSAVDGPARVDVDLSSRPFSTGFDPQGHRAGPRRVTGWL